jgi:competence protein ComEC
MSAAIVIAILIGDKAGLGPDITRRLIDAGTYHVVAISGGNVAIVTLLVIVALRGLIRSSRIVSLIALLAVVTYGWVVGGEPSVARAATAAAVWLGADAAGIRAPPLHVLSVVVLILIALDPLMVIQPGAWLSFGATAGILLGAARLAAWLLGPARPRHWWVRTAGVLASLWAATLAAELVLLPVGAWTFARVSVAGTVLNFIAIPAMAVVQVTGLVAVSLGDWWPAVAQAAAAVAHGAARVLVDSARLVEYWPALAWRVPPPHSAVVGSYYGALVVILVNLGATQIRRVAWGAAGTSLAIIATGTGTGFAAPPPGTLRITMLDVGQGDATVVQFPGGQVLVVDAGASSESFDTGERIVMPALWALGVRRVDWVAFTHADLDHIGGVAAVVHQFHPREIWEGVPVPRDDLRTVLHIDAGRQRAIWRALRQGDRWEIGGASLEVLHPPAPDWERQRVRNDDSLVFRVRYGELDVLLTGDISQVIEAELPVASDDRGGVRVLKVAHHGSRGSSSPRLLERYRPWVAVVSAGRNNAFGHPAPEVVQRLNDVGAKTFRTDRDGAVAIESAGDAVQFQTWAGGQWRLEVASP